MNADLPFFVSVLQAQSIHGAHDGSQRLDGVAVNDRLVLLYVITRETILMDNPKEDTKTDMLESTLKVDTHIAFLTSCVNVQIRP